VRAGKLELLDAIDLPEGKEVTITILDVPAERDGEASRRAAGGWKGLVDAEALIKFALEKAGTETALKEIIAFLGKKRSDEIFTVPGIEKVKAIIKSTDDVGLVVTIIRIAASGDITGDKFGILKIILDRLKDSSFIQTIGEAGIENILMALKESLRTAGVTDVNLLGNIYKELSPAIDAINKVIDTDNVYKENTSIKASMEILKGYAALIGKNRSVAMSHFLNAFEVDKNTEAESLLGVILAQARIDDGNIRSPHPRQLRAYPVKVVYPGA